MEAEPSWGPFAHDVDMGGADLEELEEEDEEDDEEEDDSGQFSAYEKRRRAR